MTDPTLTGAIAVPHELAPAGHHGAIGGLQVWGVPCVWDVLMIEVGDPPAGEQKTLEV